MGDRYTNGAIILLIIASCFIATVFVSEHITGRVVPKTEAVSVTAIYSGCDSACRRGNIRYIDMEFSDHEELTVPGICANTVLLERLEAIPAGTKLHLLVHPKSEDVLQIETNGDILLEFDYAQTRIWRDAVGFAVLGVFMYFCSGILLVGMIRKKL